jgi:signal transduction histidine kinase/CheY-like chemotaxis protein
LPVAYLRKVNRSLRLRLLLIVGGVVGLLPVAAIGAAFLVWGGPGAAGGREGLARLGNSAPAVPTVALGVAAGVLVLGLGAFWAVWGLTHRIFARVERLTRAAEDISAPGERPEGLPAGADELARLERSLAELAARVGQARHESEALNRSLTAKVRQRTEELRQKNLALAFQNEKVIEADRMKSAFFASVSHELRTPLNAILALTDMLRDEVAGPLNEEQRKHVAMVHSSGENLLNLINEVLDLARIEAGRMEVRAESVAIIDRLTAAVEELRPLADSKGLGLSVEADGQGRVVRVDSDKVRQVLINLLGNAIKFTEQGAVRVRLQLIEAERLLSVEVEDTGPGIAPEHHQQIFLEFHRLDAQGGSSQKGTGLGLAVSRQMVNLMGGDIWVDSMVGRGSRFAFVIPLERAGEAGPGDRNAADEGEEGLGERPRGGRVLVVGSEVVSSGVLSRYFRQRGMDALVAREGAFAYRLLQVEPVDLILLHIAEGGQAQIAWVEGLARNPLLSRIPLVVYCQMGLGEDARAKLAQHPAAVVLEGGRGMRELVEDAVEIHRGLTGVYRALGGAGDAGHERPLAA